MGEKGGAEKVLDAFFLFPFILRCLLKKYTPLPIPFQSPPKFFTLCDCKPCDCFDSQLLSGKKWF